MQTPMITLKLPAIHSSPRWVARKSGKKEDAIMERCLNAAVSAQLPVIGPPLEIGYLPAGKL
jgi:hypothetical protein